MRRLSCLEAEVVAVLEPVWRVPIVWHALEVEDGAVLLKIRVDDILEDGEVRNL